MQNIRRGYHSSSSQVTRRDLVRWGLASPALLSVSARGLAGAMRDRVLLLRDGDFLSDPRMLRRRLEAGHPLAADMASNALRWRLQADRNAAADALHAVVSAAPGRASSRTWPVYAQLALAADWLRTFQDFHEDLQVRVARTLREAAQEALHTPELSVPAQTSYHNYATRYLALGVFTAMVAAHLDAGHSDLVEIQRQLAIADRNVTYLAQMVTPDGGSHESMDYTRISLMPMAMLAELHRTVLGQDPADRDSFFRSFGAQYVYKLLPDGSPSREGDNEYPLLDGRDIVALGYAVNRLRDRQAAYLLRHGAAQSIPWAIPVLQFLWDDPRVAAVRPEDGHLPRARHFRGVDQVVFRSGFSAEDTRIEFDCGPYFAKHQHLDRGHFTIHHRGHLAIDSGADYTECESPHYLNYYRRSIAHNTLVVYDPNEKFFWSEDVLAAANDGGQRMDSSRFWNTVRSKQDWEATRDIWDLGHIDAFDIEDPEYCYTRGDAARAYSPAKLRRFTRELVYFPRRDILIVFDRVLTTRPELQRAWLLHTVEEPQFLPVDNTHYDRPHGGRSMPPESSGIRVNHAEGEMTLYPIFPVSHAILKRGGPDYAFWTPGDDKGGEWGSGRNWPVDPPQGGPLPENEEERKMWFAFYGQGLKALEPSNAKNVIPGSWRIEMSPSIPSLQDDFLVLFEIGAKGSTGSRPCARIESTSMKGVVYDRMAVCFVVAQANESIEFTTPPQPVESFWIAGLPPLRSAQVHVSGSNFSNEAPLPGQPVASYLVRSNRHGVASLNATLPPGSRIRLQLNLQKAEKRATAKEQR